MGDFECFESDSKANTPIFKKCYPISEFFFGNNFLLILHF